VLLLVFDQPQLFVLGALAIVVAEVVATLFALAGLREARA
jgi:hypothetical protein